MRLLTVSFALFFACFFSRLSFAQKFDFEPGSSPALTLAKIRNILQEPVIPPEVRGASLVAEGKNEFGSYDYLIKRSDVAATEIPDSLTLIPRGLEVTDFFLNLTKAETQVVEEPNWEEIIPKIDGFVKKYFPEVQRPGDWQTALRAPTLNRGVFTLSYRQVSNDVELQSVRVEVRLGSGEIASIITSTVALPKGKVTPPTVSTEKLIAAAETGLAQANTPVTQLKIENATRRGGFDPQGLPRFNYSLSLTGKNAQGKGVFVTGIYVEETETFIVDKIRDYSPSNVRTDQNYKISTQVVDNKPLWSPDGETLYFNSSRDVQGRPWWQRTANVTSILAQEADDSPVAIRPFKPLGADFNLLNLLAVSRHFIALKFNDKGFGVLDLQRGEFYLPQRDSEWTSQLQSLPPSVLKRLNDNFEFDVAGAAWLQDESGLVVSVYLDPVDRNIYLMRRQPASQVQSWQIVPVVKELGEDLLPCLSSDNALLAWVHQSPEKQDEPNSTWEFNVAPFDSVKAQIGKRQKLILSSPPLSVSWDNKGKRWLVVTQSVLLWIGERAGALSVTPVSELKWGELKLRPLSAAVSPSGDVIAVAAELEKPQSYEKAESVVQSLVFEWDGKSPQVKPFYQPSLNGLPRYVFPATKSTWAKVIGDVEKFRLEGFVDPATVANKPAG